MNKISQVMEKDCITCKIRKQRYIWITEKEVDSGYQEKMFYFLSLMEFLFQVRQRLRLLWFYSQTQPPLLLSPFIAFLPFEMTIQMMPKELMPIPSLFPHLLVLFKLY